MTRFTFGRFCLSVTAAACCIGPYAADWNVTHVKNPRWPPHAKFHNGQTMSLGLCLGLLTLYFTWRHVSAALEKDALRTAAIIGSLYSTTAISAWFYPGTAAIDEEFGSGFPQLPLFLAMSIVPWIGYTIDAAALEKRKSN